MNTEQRKVKEWHERFGVLVNPKPTLIDPDTRRLRWSLIEEEYRELVDAGSDGDLLKISDALADLLYVIYGTAVSYGIDLEPIFAEVHRSNMSKGDPKVIRAANGKILKSQNWIPPNLKPILEGLSRSS